MKVTIYELLGLIKDGKAPEKIKYQDYCWEWTGDDYETRKFGVQKFLITGQEYTWVTDFLKDEIEIIEEDKKIEKLDVELLGQCDNWLRCPTNKVTKQDIELNPYIIDTIRENTLEFQHKINEIIEIVNELKGKSE